VARLPGPRAILRALARPFAALRGRLPRLKPTRLAATAFPILMGLGIILLLGFVQVSSTPTFCGNTCHIMKPYYESWKHSSHRNIACVECHISPGITAEVRKKYEAMSMVVKYLTATYGTRPWAEVDDAACLRCHQRRLLEGKVEFHGTTFDHRPHLTESRRGLRLRCTSCHSQIVQGTHLAVTTSTCALCHFKDQPLNDKLGTCQRCHKIPERVTNEAGVPFDHSQVATLGMACTSCHEGVVRGDGSVPKERCQSCHNQMDRLKHYGDKVFLHEMHVTKHKVDCQGCHLQIEHGRTPPAPPPTTITATNTCQSCHGLGHSPQQDLYSGTGGRGVPRTPSPMFAAGVACQGCHNPAFNAQVASSDLAGTHAAPAGGVACMSCHGPSYERIFTAWRQAGDERSEALRREMDASVGAMGLDPPPAWEDARHNLALVMKGKAVHNINFSYMLLDKAFDQMNEARRVKGLAALSRPWPYVPHTSACMSCHVGIENQSADFSGRKFSHAPHLVKAGLDCQKCHRPHAERPAVEVVRFGPEGCTSCHHQSLKSAGFDACARCHGDVTRGTYPSYRGEFSHKQHLSVGLECKSCHAIQTGDPRPWKSSCTECHEETSSLPGGGAPVALGRAH
jgi:nitrate/TMAO reductase-like tetraheme cytochrome c subunit